MLSHCTVITRPLGSEIASRMKDQWVHKGLGYFLGTVQSNKGTILQDLMMDNDFMSYLNLINIKLLVYHSRSSGSLATL